MFYSCKYVIEKGFELRKATIYCPSYITMGSGTFSNVILPWPIAYWYGTEGTETVPA